MVFSSRSLVIETYAAVEVVEMRWHLKQKLHLP